MRSRFIVLVVAILLVAGFAALNWSEIVRPSPLLFGPFVMDAPMGLILLGLLALSLIAFLASTAHMRTQSLIETRHHYKSLEAQRELADKAEASRFTDLRQHLDLQLRQLRERDTVAVTEFQKSVVESQRELRTHLEQINRTIASRLNEIEQRLDSRLGGSAVPARTVTPPLATPVQQPVQAEHVGAHEARAREQDLREQQERERQLRDQRARAEQQPNVEQRPAESGWRKWF
jgi:hypothetical protein